MALHGWCGSARGWGSLPDYLDGSAFTYVFPDLRGYGGRRDVTGEFTMAEAAADALALADELGWERFAMIGHSMSGKRSSTRCCRPPAGSPGWWRSTPCPPPACRSTTTAGRCSPAPPPTGRTAPRSSP